MKNMVILVLLIGTPQVTQAQSPQFAFGGGWKSTLSMLPDSESKAQLESGGWLVVDDSQEEGFSAAVASSDSSAILIFGCLVTSSDRSLWVGAFWEESGALGTYYDNQDLQPVTLNWRRPNETQQQRWYRLATDTSNGVLIFAALQDSEVENVFRKVHEHEQLEVVVETRPGQTESATFPLPGAPTERARKVCGESVTEETPSPPVDLTASKFHIFPQIADGRGADGNVYSSWLYVMNVNPEENTCTYSLRGVDLDRLVSLPGVRFTVELETPLPCLSLALFCI